MNKYEVPIIYRGMENHMVEAENEAEAVRKARELFGTAAKPVILGNEWEEIITINTPRLLTRLDPPKEDLSAILPNRSPRDWTEDFPGENGCYENHCCQCRQKFYGHKRRVLCRECAEHDPQTPA